MRNVRKWVYTICSAAFLIVLAAAVSYSESKIPFAHRIEDLAAFSDIPAVQEIPSGYDDAVLTWRIRYLSDECEVVGFISAPKDYLEKAGKYPVLIYNRGGNGEFFKLKAGDTASLARRGFITFGSQLRGVDGGTGKEEFGGRDVSDIIKLIDIVERCGFVDPEQIIMLGASRGGMMTYLVLREETRIKAAAVIGGVADLAAVYKQRPDMRRVLNYRVGGSPAELPEEYAKRSAVNWAAEINVPLLIFHAADDKNAPISQTDAFVKELEKHGKEFEYIRTEKGGHGFFDFTVFLKFAAQYVNAPGGISY